MNRINKKGVEMTMNTVIVAALLLLVMVVSLVIFGKNMMRANEDTDVAYDGQDCPKECYVKFSCDSGERQAVGNFAVLKEGKVCCCKT